MLGTYASSLCARTVARGTARSAQRLGLPRRGLHAAASGNSDVDILQEWAGLKPATSGLTRQGAVDLEIGTQGVATVTLQRPEKLNAFNMQMFRDLELAFDEIESRRQEVNCVLLQGAGDQFTAGLDLSALMALQQILGGVKCPSQMREHLVSVVSRFQTIFSRPERCHAPVIAATKGLVVGAGIDLITACDLRLCEKSARMTVKEVDLAIVADLGTLQRLPLVIGEQRARELAYTGRFVSGPEAERIGLVLECLEDAESLQTRADELAREIAAKSPITVRGIKANMNYSRDHTVDEGLEYVLRWNGAHLLSADLQQAAVQAAKRTKNKKKPE